MADSAAVLQKKKEKHSQTEGSFRKAMGCSALAPAAGLAWPQEPWLSSMAARCQYSRPITASATAAVPR